MKPEAEVWLAQAKEHLADMEYLFDGRRYSMAVYCAHQALEKLIKAVIVEKTTEMPPKLHKLDELATRSTLPFSDEWKEDLAEITRHFWRVRYPDFQQYVYNSKEKVMPTVAKTREIYLWILQQLQQR